MEKEKIMKAILHTKGKTDEQILKDGGMVSKDDIEVIRAYMDAWDGVEVLVRPCFDGDGYVMVGWDESDVEINAKVKEAVYLMEQDPVFGTYIDSREEFDHDWREAKYEPDGCISFDEQDVEIFEETDEAKLARLISSHPGIPVIAMVEYEVVGDDESRRWAGSVSRCHVTEYVYAEEGSTDGKRIWQKHHAGDLVDLMMKNVAKEEYEAARQQAWEKVEAMPWKKAIIVNIDLPEGE